MTVKQLKTVIEELNRNRGARPGSQHWVKKSYKTREIMLAKVIAEHQRPITIQHIQREVAQNLLATWCMKKISSDKRPVLAMGSRNEAFIRDAIPSFLYEHADVIVIQLREYGLLENKGMPFICGSLDLLGLLCDTKTCESYIAMFECKTCISTEVKAKADAVAQQYGRYFECGSAS